METFYPGAADSQSTQQCSRCGLIHPSYPPCSVDLEALQKQKENAQNARPQVPMMDAIDYATPIRTKPIIIEDGNEVLNTVPIGQNSDDPIPIMATPISDSGPRNTSIGNHIRENFYNEPSNQSNFAYQISELDKFISQAKPMMAAYIETKNVNDKAFCQYILVEITKAMSKFDDKFLPSDKIEPDTQNILNQYSIPNRSEIKTKIDNFLVENMKPDDNPYESDEALDGDDIEDIDSFVDKIEKELESDEMVPDEE